MTPALRDTLIDGVTIAVALWFLFGTAFADMRGPVIDAVAGLVLGYSLWRIIRRHWRRS